MREILFRGKRIDNGEWIEGYYAAEPYTKSTYNYGYILENEKDLYAKKAYLVDSRTVGQFTGLTDKNGRKIFEGDIVTIRDSAEGVLVEFIDGEYQCTNRIKYKYYRHPLEYYHDEPKYTVIGNIHDNPELLEVAE